MCAYLSKWWTVVSIENVTNWRCLSLKRLYVFVSIENSIMKNKWNSNIRKFVGIWICCFSLSLSHFVFLRQLSGCLLRAFRKLKSCFLFLRWTECIWWQETKTIIQYRIDLVVKMFEENIFWNECQLNGIEDFELNAAKTKNCGKWI